MVSRPSCQLLCRVTTQRSTVFHAGASLRRVFEQVGEHDAQVAVRGAAGRHGEAGGERCVLAAAGGGIVRDDGIDRLIFAEELRGSGDRFDERGQVFAEFDAVAVCQLLEIGELVAQVVALAADQLGVFHQKLAVLLLLRDLHVQQVRFHGQPLFQLRLLLQEVERLHDDARKSRARRPAGRRA